MIRTQPDVSGEFHLLSTNEGGRSSQVRSGYRPHHAVRPDYFTTGVHHYHDTETLQPGESAKVSVTFIKPDAYPASLLIGQRIAVHEGSRLVGYLDVHAIHNPLLDASSQESADDRESRHPPD